MSLLCACAASHGSREAPASPPHDPAPPSSSAAPEPAPASPSSASAPAPAPADDVSSRLAQSGPAIESACAAHSELTCTRDGDLDGDGRRDSVALVRARGSDKLGLAITWGRGGEHILGAGQRGGDWRETIDDSVQTVPIPEDLDFLASWDLWRADGPPGKRRGFVDGRGRKFALRGVVGDGIYVSGGDSAAVVYWDGAGWRIDHLGF